MEISINIVKLNQNDTDKTNLHSNSILLKGEFTHNDTCSSNMNIFKVETNNYCHN